MRLARGLTDESVCPTLLAAFLLLTGCGHYAEFTLPPLGGGDPRLSYEFEAEPQAVLTRGSERDVLNPSVIRRGAELWNLYSAYDGRAWHTGLATSSDGVRWQRQGRVLSPDPQSWEGHYNAANGSALWYADQIW